jgi:hypothetical protein
MDEELVLLSRFRVPGVGTSRRWSVEEGQQLSVRLALS